MNIIAQLEFELIYIKVLVHHFSYYIIGTPLPNNFRLHCIYIYIYIYIFIIQCVKACVIPCPHQPPTRGDKTVLVAQGGTATPGTTKQLLPLEIYIYIYVYIYIILLIPLYAFIYIHIYNYKKNSTVRHLAIMNLFQLIPPYKKRNSSDSLPITEIKNCKNIHSMDSYSLKKPDGNIWINQKGRLPQKWDLIKLYEFALYEIYRFIY